MSLLRSFGDLGVIGELYTSRSYGAEERNSPHLMRDPEFLGELCAFA